MFAIIVFLFFFLMGVLEEDDDSNARHCCFLFLIFTLVCLFFNMKNTRVNLEAILNKILNIKIHLKLIS